MYKHLFLEADSGAGKSTLIRKLIRPYITEIGGFSSQRLIDNNGETIAFRIVSAGDLRLSVPYEDTPETIFRIISRDHSSESFSEVFDSAGLDLLNGTSQKKLILLDEIGGLELKSKPFKDKLFEILSGDTPCIGVIKQQKKALYMSDNFANNSSVSVLNNALRKMMHREFSCKILQFKRNDPTVESEVRDFVNHVFND